MITEDKHFEFIRQLICCSCNSMDMLPPNQVSHTSKDSNRGIAYKANIDCVVPQCHKCHIGEAHRIGEITFWGEAFEDVKNLSKKLYEISGDVDQGNTEIIKFKRRNKLFKGVFTDMAYIKNETDLNHFIRDISKLDLSTPKLIEVKDNKKVRTLAQNRLCRLWDTEIANFVGENADVMHNKLLCEYSGSVDIPYYVESEHIDYVLDIWKDKVSYIKIEQFNNLLLKIIIVMPKKRTSEMSIKEKKEYLDWLHNYAIKQQINITIPTYYYEAF